MPTLWIADQWERIQRSSAQGEKVMWAAMQQTTGCSLIGFFAGYRTGVPWRDLPACFGDWDARIPAL